MTTTVVSSGQTVSSATISSGDTEVVVAGGSSVDPNAAGGTLSVSGGTATGGSVTDGGTLLVSDGGQALGMTISGASGIVSSGGVVSGTVVAGGGVLDVGSFDGTSGPAGSALGYGGLATATIVSDGGSLDVGSGGAARTVTVSNGGTMFVAMSGYADDITVASGGTMSIGPIGYATGILVASGGTLDVTSPVGPGIGQGDARSVTIGAGGSANVQGGSLYGSAMGGAQVNVGLAGSFSGGVQGSGTTVTVESGGRFWGNGASIVGGTVLVESGGAFETVSGIHGTVVYPQAARLTRVRPAVAGRSSSNPARRAKPSVF